MVETYKSRSVNQTLQVAAALAATLRGGECIALHGELGAGKTQFTRGIVQALGGDPQQVSSPTFVLLHIYQTPTLKVFHLDAYRAGGADELESIGFGELLTQGGIVIIEWASKIASLLPADHIAVHLRATGARSREITIERVR